MFNIGDKLWCYTARNGKFHIREGVVNPLRGSQWRTRPVVKFKGSSKWDYIPKEEDVGRLVTGGPKLWLTERDDNLARKLFIEHEEGKVAELEKAIEKRRELIRVLKESDVHGY